MKPRKLLLGAVTLTSCFLLSSCSENQQSGICDSVSGACLDLHVSYHMQRMTNYSLEVTAIYDGSASKRISSIASAVGLPGHLRIVPPPGISATDITAIAIRAIDGGNLIATARIDDPFMDNFSHRELTTELAQYSGEMFSDQSSSYLACKGARSTRIADIDQDGHNDIVVTCYNESKIAVLYGTVSRYPKSLFDRAQPNIDRIGKNAYFSAVLDVDLNGTLDIVTPSYEDGTMGRNGISIVTSMASRGWTPPTLVKSSEPFLLDAISADYAGDGTRRLIISNHQGVSALLLYPTLFFLDSSKTHTKVNLPQVSGAYSLTAGRLDEDNTDDIVVAGNSSNNLAIVRGLSNLSAPIISYLQTGLSPMTPVIADVDNDQKSDIIISHCNKSDPSVVIYKNIGRGQFEKLSEIYTGTASCSTAADDFDRDGNIDLAIRNGADSTISILKGTGKGAFFLTQTLVNSDISYYGHLSSGDLNNDGMSDIILSGNASSDPLAAGNTISIHYNKVP